ncbi:MAG: hypothetical protein ACLGIG_11620 [Actinomycetes bacterium]
MSRSTAVRVAVGVVAVGGLVLLRPRLADGVAALADGDRTVAFLLGMLPWLALVLPLVSYRLHRQIALVWLGLWLAVLGSPALSRIGTSSVERSLEERAPGYFEGWLAATAAVVVLGGASYVWARRTGRIPPSPGRTPSGR